MDNYKEIREIEEAAFHAKKEIEETKFYAKKNLEYSQEKNNSFKIATNPYLAIAEGIGYIGVIGYILQRLFL